MAPPRAPRLRSRARRSAPARGYRAVPKLCFEHPRALEEVVRRHLPGEAHAAEDLHRGAPVGDARPRRRAASPCSRRSWRRRPRSSSKIAAAAYVALRASSTRTYMSASRCLTAWNEPIGTPNCWRSSAYADATSSAPCATPTSCAAASTVPTSRNGSASSGPPIVLAARKVAKGERRGERIERFAGRSDPASADAANDVTPVVVEHEDDVALGGVLDDEGCARRRRERRCPATRTAPAADVGHQAARRSSTTAAGRWRGARRAARTRWPRRSRRRRTRRARSAAAAPNTPMSASALHVAGSAGVRFASRDGRRARSAAGRTPGSRRAARSARRRSGSPSVGDGDARRARLPGPTGSRPCPTGAARRARRRAPPAAP